MIRFAEPIYLWLLAVLPLAWLMAGRLRLIAPLRRATIIGLRTLLLLCVILALSRLEWVRRSRDLSVFYLLDRSESVPPSLQDEQLRLVKTLSSKASPRDFTGVIAFGREPSLETSPVRPFDFEGRLFSAVETDRTDISAAARLALAAFPADTMKRMVLVSDGNENIGSILEIARISRNVGVPIDVLPMLYEARADVQVEKVVVPQRTSRDAPFDLKIFLESQAEATGTLRIFEDGKLIGQETVTVRPGRNAPLVMSRRLSEGGFHQYTATFEAPNDTRPQNNTGSAFTYLRAEPRVLLAEGGDLQNTRYLVGALQAENIRTDVIPSTAIPLAFEQLQRYDALVLSNVAANDMSTAQMQMIERAVHDLGIGLIMIGGENSFGAGGYNDTPIETALPVDMDIKQKKMLPNGAMVIVLHTCEIPSGNAWAREISLASLGVLSTQDYFGLVYFGSGPGTGGSWGDAWGWDPAIQMVGDKKMMRTRIKGIQPLDAPSFDSLLSAAADELVPIKAQTKHIVVISDGDPAPPTQATVTRIRDAGITVSGVAIAPHDVSTVNSLKEMAFWGAGNFYYPKTGEELPRIFTKEATIVRKSLIRETPFLPNMAAPSEVVTGFRALPQLRGYVITSPKELATVVLTSDEEDPVLAHWRYGLGKTLAFTSDAKDKWASDWVAWGSFSKFWAQAVRWVLRETNNLNYDVNTEIAGGVGRVTVDAVDEGGNFENFLNFKTTVIGPDYQPMDVEVTQVAPGRYEGTFPASKVGTYMLSMTTGNKDEQGEPVFLTSGVSLSYSPEYETSASNDLFLRKVADESGGAYIQSPDAYNPYLRNLPPSKRPIPLWPALLLAATILLPIDIFLRRVYLDWREIGAWLARNVMFWRRAPASPADTARIEALRQAKTRANRSREEEQQEREAREAFRQKLAQQSKDQPQGTVFQDPKDVKPITRAGGKQTVTPESGNTPAGDQPGGISSLMEAKKRAAQQRRKK